MDQRDRRIKALIERQMARTRKKLSRPFNPRGSLVCGPNKAELRGDAELQRLIDEKHAELREAIPNARKRKAEIDRWTETILPTPQEPTTLPDGSVFLDCGHDAPGYKKRAAHRD